MAHVAVKKIQAMGQVEYLIFIIYICFFFLSCLSSIHYNLNKPYGANTVGILVGMPDSYYRRVVKESLGVKLGPLNSYGTGIVFLPQPDAALNALKEIFESQAKQRGLKVIGWRSIDTGHLLSFSLSFHFIYFNNDIHTYIHTYIHTNI